MKIIRIAFLALLVFSINACSKNGLKENVPNCIEKKINKIANDPVQNPAAEVWKWQDDVNTYYYFTSDCCDQFDYLYDDECNVVCAPSGGFTGAGDGNCPSFQGQITHTLIWKDPR